MRGSASESLQRCHGSGTRDCTTYQFCLFQGEWRGRGGRGHTAQSGDQAGDGGRRTLLKEVQALLQEGGHLRGEGAGHALPQER
jgi:hypothetical protein